MLRQLVRARDLFAPEIVMAAHEELFAELEQRRRHAPADAHCPRPVSPQLDPVSVFEHFASHPSGHSEQRCIAAELAGAVRQQRAALWQNPWRNRCQSPSATVWRKTWLANITRRGVLINKVYLMTRLSYWIRLRHLLIVQPLAALAVSNSLHHSLRVHFDLAVESWIDLGVSNLACPAAHGSGARTHDTLAG